MSVDLGRIQPGNRYVAIARTTLQQAIAYRVSTLINTALTFIWVFILYYLWRAGFSGQNTIEGYTWDDMRTYIVLAYGINALVGWRVGSQMMYTIRTGDILREIVRPLNYCLTQLSRAVGYSIVEGMSSLLLSLVVGMLIFRIHGPDSPAMAGLFVVSVMLGFVTKVLVMFCVSLLMFWTMNGVGLMWSQVALLQVFSGTIVPIAFMPGWLRVIAEWLPLRGIVSTPITVYLGKADTGEIVQLIGLQVIWAVALWFFANWAWTRAFDAVEIQGG